MKTSIIVSSAALSFASSVYGAPLWESTVYFSPNTSNIADSYWETLPLSAHDPLVPEVVLKSLVDQTGVAIISTCNKGVFTPDRNIGQAVGASWTLDLSYSNVPTDVRSLTSARFEVFSSNAGGSTLSSDSDVKPQLLVYDGTGNLVQSFWASNADENHVMWVDQGTSRSGLTDFVDFDLSGLQGFDLSGGFTFSLVMADGGDPHQPQGFYVGVKSVIVNGDVVPEPSTGILGVCGMICFAFKRRSRPI